MKIKLFLLTWLMLPLAALAQRVNLIPKPQSLTMGSGNITLTPGFAVSYGSLPDSISGVAARFVSDINATTGLGARALSTQDGLVRLSVDGQCAPEGYRLQVTPEHIHVTARTTAGFYYAFQTLKKMLPPHVMAGKYAAGGTYTLPALSITDEPRFGYRGFMLDVSRHFFPVEQIKRMIDLMAIYKMNVFHWHLTDDQGWRAEIKKYPRLTSVGSVAANVRMNDMVNGMYWTNRPYGPHFYTQEEMREVVAYARDRHIHVLPEVDMPGHFCAAMASYPEFSCWPDGQHAVQTHQGGIYTDILNVANPRAVQFAKDILDELADIFPYPYIHIGGDECPTTAWEQNAECQALKARLNLPNYRHLQSHFIKDLSDHVQKKGKKLMVWNEAITADGPDLQLMKETGATVMCWNPCQAGARQAAQLGLNAIITEYHTSGGGYYINRKQHPADPYAAAGHGDDTVEGSYNYVPVPDNVETHLTPYYKGVQGTFWTEFVCERRYLEYLALPRLIAIAETGWTPQNQKNFADFKDRLAQDTTLLNLAGYEYARHIWAADHKVMPQSGKWHHIQTMAGDVRKGTRIELLAAGSPLIKQHADKGAQAGRLWNSAARETDHQLWAFEESPTQPGLYALVCKAQPQGSLRPTPSATANTGRWTYDNTQKHYAFVLGDGGYGPTSSGNRYYTIRAAQLSGWYLNSSMGGQGFAVNLWTNPADGSGGLWEFLPFDSGEGTGEDAFDQALYDALPKLQDRDTLRIRCSVPGFEDVYLSHRLPGNLLTWSDGEAQDIDWVAYKVTSMDRNYTQTAILRNHKSKQYLSLPAANSTGSIGYPVSCAISYSQAPAVTLQYLPATGDYQVLVGGRNLFPVPLGSTVNPGTVSSGSTTSSSGLAVRPQGACWQWEAVTPTSLHAPQTVTQAEGIHDLTGRPVKRITRPGIYLIDGAKHLLTPTR